MPTDTKTKPSKKGVSPSKGEKTAKSKGSTVGSSRSSEADVSPQQMSKIERLKTLHDREKAARTRSEQASTRLTPGEFARLSDLADELGMSNAATVRLLIIGGMSESLLPERVAEDMSLLQAEVDRLSGLIEEIYSAHTSSDAASLNEVIVAAHNALSA